MEKIFYKKPEIKIVELKESLLDALSQKPDEDPNNEAKRSTFSDEPDFD